MLLTAHEHQLLRNYVNIFCNAPVQIDTLRVWRRSAWRATAYPQECRRAQHGVQLNKMSDVSKCEPAIHSLDLWDLWGGGGTDSYISVSFCTLYIFYSVVISDSLRLGDSNSVHKWIKLVTSSRQFLSTLYMIYHFSIKMPKNHLTWFNSCGHIFFRLINSLIEWVYCWSGIAKKDEEHFPLPMDHTVSSAV